MKHMGLAMAVLATTVTIACNNTTTSNTAGTEAATVGTAGDDHNAIRDTEREFVAATTAAGMAEVEFGTLATTRAANAQVKAFGEMMVRDHTKAGGELKEVARRFNIAPADALSVTNRELRDRLTLVQGHEFDVMYMDAMVQAHEGVVDVFQGRVDRQLWDAWKASFSTLTDDVKGNTHLSHAPVEREKTDNVTAFELNKWAARTLPTTYYHLDKARAVQKAVNTRNTTH